MPGPDRATWETALELLSRGEREEARRLLDDAGAGPGSAEGDGRPEGGAARRNQAEGDARPATELDRRIETLLACALDPTGARAFPTEPEGAADPTWDDGSPAASLASALQDLHRARLALRRGHTEALRRHASRAHDRLPDRWSWPRLLLASLHQAVFRFSGEREQRERGLGLAGRVAERVDEPHMAVLARGILGTMHLLSGRLHAVAASCQAAIELAAATGLEEHRVVALAHQFRGYALFEWNRLAEARQDLDRAWALTGPEDRGIRSGVARVMAALATAQEDPERAETWLARLEEIVSEPMTLRNREWLAAVRIRQGLQTDRDLRAIDAWRQSYDYRPDAMAELTRDEVAQRLHEYEHLLTVLETTGQWDALLTVADTVLRGSEPLRLGYVVRGLGARAVALEASGRADEADQSWAEALERGAPEGFTRVHLEGEPIRLRLLRRAVERDPDATEARRVLEAAGEGGDGRHDVALTPKQREVLGHVARGLSNRQIARELGVAETTVRTHLREVYARMEVGSRTAAVAVARRLGLIGS